MNVKAVARAAAMARPNPPGPAAASEEDTVGGAVEEVVVPDAVEVMAMDAVADPAMDDEPPIMLEVGAGQPPAMVDDITALLGMTAGA